MADEKRLILADDLKLAIRDDPYIDGNHYARVKRHINEAKTVDAVEVVRCKYCQWYYLDECANPYVYISDGGHLYTQPDDFCSYGERKDHG